MVSSMLSTARGELPKTSAFDLSAATNVKLEDIWSEPALQLQHGELWISYPFEERYDGLDHKSRHPDLATVAKTQIDLHLTSIVDQAVSFGMRDFTVRWAAGELLTNATQYGALSEMNAAAGLIRLEWRLDRDETGPMFAVAVANPCIRLFDPSRFARMESVDFFAMENSSTNGHLFTIGLLSYLKENTKLTYLWEMANGERMKLTMERIPEDAPDRPANYDELMKPTRVEVFKFDPSNQPIPYSFEEFQQDVANGVGTESVTISCVVSDGENPRDA
ncbi:MAG: hypothetical protein RL518_2280 [Pseudomonadota bacterium]|jgi:hypothetical protein